MGPQLTSLLFALGFLAIAVLYTLTLYNTLNAVSPTNRKIQSGLIWLFLIPVFHLIWHFVIVNKLSESIKAEYLNKGQDVPEFKPGYGSGIIASFCWIASFTLSTFQNLANISITPINMFEGLLNIVGVIAWVLYWIKIAGYKKKIQTLNTTS
jgi:hypothetical protein